MHLLGKRDYILLVGPQYDAICKITMLQVEVDRADWLRSGVNRVAKLRKSPILRSGIVSKKLWTFRIRGIAIVGPSVNAKCAL